MTKKKIVKKIKKEIPVELYINNSTGSTALKVDGDVVKGILTYKFIDKKKLKANVMVDGIENYENVDVIHIGKEKFNMSDDELDLFDSSERAMVVVKDGKPKRV